MDTALGDYHKSELARHLKKQFSFILDNLSEPDSQMSKVTSGGGIRCLRIRLNLDQ